ncbi:MAG: class I SAM-dependent methyltransferase [Bacillota bacterium]
MDVNMAYSQAFNTGLYGKPTGLRGKYDNVRRFWEDGITRRFIGTHMNGPGRPQKIRVMDLGCGSGDGYELIAGITADGKDIELYTGIEINPNLLEQGKSIYRKYNNVCFRQGSFSDGLPVREGEQPYHLYLSTYGTLSHCSDTEAVRLLADIARHGGSGAVAVADWLGCYSCEWQDLWTPELPPDHFIDYVVSYLLDEEDRTAARLEKFPLRLMDRRTIIDLVNRAGAQAGRNIRVLNIFDRSVFVGRHMETSDYHGFPQALRGAVNSLWEQGRRTNLRELRVNYLPREGFDFANSYFQTLSGAWNTLVEYTEQLLSGVDPAPLPANSPPVLKQAVDAMGMLIKRAAFLELEDPRANIIEPQLAYLLRGLETSLQRGEGMAHGIVAILQVE